MSNPKFAQIKERLLGRLSVQQRQWLLMGGIGAGFVLGMWVLFSFGSDAPRRVVKDDPFTIAPKPAETPIMASGQTIKPVDKWIATAGKEVEELKKDRKETATRMLEQERQNKALMSQFAELQRKLSEVEKKRVVEVVEPKLPNLPEPVSPPKEVERPTTAKLPPLPPPPRPSAGQPDLSAGVLPSGVPGSFMEPAPSAGLVRVSVSAVPSVPSVGSAGTADSKSAPKSIENFLPISFTRAVMLGGLDAPTGGQSQGNPHPVLLRLEDNAMLPNRFRAQVKECFVIGAGYGDLSSERAYIRTERLSCVRNDGVSIEIRIKGSVFGEDGKVGVRGRLISKQGQVLANALAAGVASGIGAGMQARFSVPNQNASGGSVPDPNYAYENGFGQGVGKAMDRLAQYYITLAEKMFPIIEVDAGRLVDVVLTEGVDLDDALIAKTGSASSRDTSDAPRSRGAQLRTIGAHDAD